VTGDEEPIRPPGRLDLLQELRLPLDALRWAPEWLRHRPRRAGHPQPVVLLPGYGAGPRSMQVLRFFLQRRGHHVRDWGLGRNDGDASRLRAGLVPVIEAVRQRHDGAPVTLVGWSLGGYIAREYAREHPVDVRRVVTLGSPVVGGPRYTATANRYRQQGYDLDRVEQAVFARYANPLRVPVVAIYSKRDGIVAWRACIDRWSEGVRHVEVDETHVGLVLSPRVLGIVADEVERAPA
jgi:pimeloyl-ACP methyl ester carboxylesterase